MTDVVRTAIAAELAALQRDTRVTRTANGYGVDLLCVDDITERADDTPEDGDMSLRQDLYHRSITKRGTLPTDAANPDPDEVNFGTDVIGFLHQPMTERALLAIGGQLRNEYLQDDRVAEAEVTATFTHATKELRISAVITPQNPAISEFALIITVNTLTGAATLES